MSSLTDGAEDRALNWLTGNTTTAPTAPLKVALITTTTPSTDAAAGSEVTGGSYARQTVTFTASSTGGSAASNVTLTFTNMPAATIGGIEIWDSAGTPFRWWWGPLSANKTTNLGDTFTIASGSLTLTMA